MKTQNRIKKVKPTKTETIRLQNVKTETANSLAVTQVGPPPPDVILREAMGEPDRRLLKKYGDTIRVLRDNKRFSFREIAEWLVEYDIECDHNSVYREYTKGLSSKILRNNNMAQDLLH